MTEHQLQGSGGHVVAELTDAQAKAADLGVGKLFLAPVGKIPAEKMLRHFCKDCNKPFDGPPGMSVESTNESVSENMILIERGQYVCKECNHVIGEYRVFEKPDEGKDAGAATPGG